MVDSRARQKNQPADGSHVAKMSSVRKLLWDCLFRVIFVGQSLKIQDGGDIGCYPPTIMVQRWSQWACFGRIKDLVLEEPIFFNTEAWLVCTCEFHYILAPESFMEMFTEKSQLPTSRVVENNTFGRKRIKANPPFEAQILLKITICCQRLHFLCEKTTNSQRAFTTGTDFLDVFLFENLPMTRWKTRAIGCCHWVNPKNSGLTWPSQWLNSWEGMLGGTELRFCNIKPA